MGLEVAAVAGLGIITAGSQIAQGYAESGAYKAQATMYDLEAHGYNEQATILNAEIDALDQLKILQGSRYARQRRRMEGTVISQTAKSGFKLSGSPIEVLMDGLTQLQLDESIEAFNVELSKYNVKGQQRQYRMAAAGSSMSATMARQSAKASIFAGYSGAFQSALQTGVLMAGMKDPGTKTTKKTTTRTTTRTTRMPSARAGFRA